MMTLYLLRYVIFLLGCAVCIAAAPEPAGLAERQLPDCPRTCTPRVSVTSTIFISRTSTKTATATATATITTTRTGSTITKTNVSTVTRLATSTRTTTVTKISTTTATTTNTRVIPTTLTTTRLIPTTTTTTITNTIRTSTVTTTITRTCSTVSPTPCTRTISFDQFTTTAAGTSYPPVPTGDPSTFGINFDNFVVYEGRNIPAPPSSPKCAAILNGRSANISSEVPFTLSSFRVYCAAQAACNVTLRAFSSDADGSQRQSGGGWFTVNADGFLLAAMNPGSLAGFFGSFGTINRVLFAPEFSREPRSVFIDDVVFSRDSVGCTA